MTNETKHPSRSFQSNISHTVSESHQQPDETRQLSVSEEKINKPLTPQSFDFSCFFTDQILQT